MTISEVQTSLRELDQIIDDQKKDYEHYKVKLQAKYDLLADNVDLASDLLNSSYDDFMDCKWLNINDIAQNLEYSKIHINHALKFIKKHRKKFLKLAKKKERYWNLCLLAGRLKGVIKKLQEEKKEQEITKEVRRIDDPGY